MSWVPVLPLYFRGPHLQNIIPKTCSNCRVDISSSLRHLLLSQTCWTITSWSQPCVLRPSLLGWRWRHWKEPPWMWAAVGKSWRSMGSPSLPTRTSWLPTALSTLSMSCWSQTQVLEALLHLLFCSPSFVFLGFFCQRRFRGCKLVGFLWQWVDCVGWDVTMHCFSFQLRHCLSWPRNLKFLSLWTFSDKLA